MQICTEDDASDGVSDDVSDHVSDDGGDSKSCLLIPKFDGCQERKKERLTLPRG